MLGRNGVGKSSLMRAIVGLEQVQSGRILWEGKDIARMAPAERARAGIGYVPQGREIFPFLTVQENLETALAAAPARLQGAGGDLRALPDPEAVPARGGAATSRAGSSSSWRSAGR